jgi:ketosteroid isomerase-like protein
LPQPLNQEQTNVGLVKRFNDALNARDIEALTALLSPDTVFENTDPPPDGERFVGRPPVRAFWESFLRSSNRSHFEIEEIFGTGSRVVMRWKYDWVNPAGQSGHIRGVDVYTLSHGLIAEKLSYVKG